MDYQDLYLACQRILIGLKEFTTIGLNWFFTEISIRAGLLGEISITPFELLTTTFFAVVIFRLIFPE